MIEIIELKSKLEKLSSKQGQTVTLYSRERNEPVSYVRVKDTLVEVDNTLATMWGERYSKLKKERNMAIRKINEINRILGNTEDENNA